MNFLSRDDILNAADRTFDTVSVPEWGGVVRLRSLTGTERDNFEASLSKTKAGRKVDNLKNFRARLVALCIVDGDGRLLFTANDVDALGRKSVAALQRVFDKCNEMNRFSDEDIEELTEDFGVDPEGDSTSG